MKVNINFRLGPFVEILDDDPDKEFRVEFINSDTNNKLHTTKIKSNHWCRCSIKYYIPWLIHIYDEKNELVYTHMMDLKDKEVRIILTSKSLGDTMAWFPYADEFRKKHQCMVNCSTFMNYYFEKSYPELRFSLPNQDINNPYAEYRIGVFMDPYSEPIITNLIPIQQIATNILGLEFNEIKPKLKFKPKSPPKTGKYITIAPSSTSGLKEWDNENWETLCKYLKSKGYTVINVSPEKNLIKSAQELKRKKPIDILSALYNSDFFIGLSSGISWLCWAVGTHVVMIANFTREGTEFTSNCTRITNTNVCHGCWNHPSYMFDKDDWFWCPEHKGTDRQFECHKSITPEMVLNQIKHML